MIKRSKIDTLTSQFRQTLSNLLRDGFTGDLTFFVKINQGGIRGAKECVSEAVDGGRLVKERVL